ncbi:hypothetical protein B0T20DRAFT_198917 [Sordaria brevicollis]|uniref:LrgB-like protein n=1 Tax=Sordaria brevicollis TaxID=83679 RepID=A0AAE0PGA4_SORBR|nr:hypothetical protein B0T20DRAFT_198917 [Sordaria brevicollis]
MAPTPVSLSNSDLPVPATTDKMCLTLLRITTWRQRCTELWHCFRLQTQPWDGVVASLLVLLAQLIIAGIDLMLDDHSVDFPPSILAMVSVFVIVSAMGCVVARMEGWYQKYLNKATNLLNRHMSIGFTIPFVMICREPLAEAGTVGLVIACFVLTAIINTAATYLLAFPIQSLMVRWKSPTPPAYDESDNIEVTVIGPGRKERWSWISSKIIFERDSMASSFSFGVTHSGDESACEGTRPPTRLEKHHQTTSEVQQLEIDMAKFTAFERWVIRNPMIVLFWFLTFTVGIPLRYAVHHDASLATFLLFASWLTMLEIQRAVKEAECLANWLRIALTGSLNPVLWTSFIMMGYIYIDAAISGRELGKMLDTLQTKTTLSHLLLHGVNGGVDAEGNKLNVSMAAGDIAQSILNAGLVAWGLKLYEYRRQLLSRAGLTVLIVSSILAIGNFTLGPLLTHAMGLGPASRNIAYTARSVTIAMGAPVMAMMGGDASLNATMVVISGIIYQMGLGFGVGGWLERTIFSRFVNRPQRPTRNTAAAVEMNPNEEEKDNKPEGEAKTEPLASASKTEHLTVPVAFTHQNSRVSFDLEAQQVSRGGPTATPGVTPAAQGAGKQGVNDPHTVAAGVTIGINSAAMGTAYLYEVGSEAAPYSALAMMALGVMTVGFASIKPLAEWVVRSVGGGVA